MKKLIALGAIASLAMLFGGGAFAAEHAAVGAAKCKMCHKVQYESWAQSKHATGKEKVECETCHGNGADYMKMSVMKDLAKAKAAGLMMPDKSTCTAKCHKAADITDEKVATVHAHKVKK
jgi:hypothetical protein